MWIINLLNKQLVLNTWVAHGSGSGQEMANHFSDANDSHESSLGFYVTDKVYNGKHGRSLYLDGMDEGFNGNARMRSIVVHGANYVGPAAINDRDISAEALVALLYRRKWLIKLSIPLPAKPFYLLMETMSRTIQNTWMKRGRLT